MDYLARAIDDVHGDEHLQDEIVHNRNCIGDPDIYCSCMGELEAQRVMLSELDYD